VETANVNYITRGGGLWLYVL